MNFNINSSSKRCQIRVREREKRFDEPQIDDGKQWNVGGFFYDDLGWGIQYKDKRLYDWNC